MWKISDFFAFACDELRLGHRSNRSIGLPNTMVLWVCLGKNFSSGGRLGAFARREKNRKNMTCFMRTVRYFFNLIVAAFEFTLAIFLRLQKNFLKLDSRFQKT